MRYKKWLIMLLLPIISQAKWIELGENDRSIFFYDNTSITTKGSVKKFLLLLNFLQESEENVVINGETRYFKAYSSTVWTFLSCKEPKIYFASYAFHSLPMGQGELLAEENLYSKFEDMPKMHSKDVKEWPSVKYLASQICK